MHAILETNLLIDALPARQRIRILKLCTLVDLDFGTVLCEADRSYQHVYFPLSGFISVTAIVAKNPPLELGLIGNEGMLGIGTVLGVDHALKQSVVQGSGTALMVSVAEFRRVLLESPALVKLLNRYIYVAMKNFAQAAVCIHCHEIEARLARWLLMADDRANGDTILLTQEFLARMLGVRRSGVSIAASALREKSLISYARGKIRILERKGLEAASCSCYKAMQRNYNKLLSQRSTALA